ncbi:unnamed protein product [Heterosigma akashiwo]
MMSNPKTLSLYRRIVASIRLLEPESKSYYLRFARGHIRSHDDEDDSERLEFLLQKGEQHRKWILAKYKKQDPCKSL